MGLDEKLINSIVIIDEAHNIENVCRDAAKFRLTFDEFSHVKSEIQKALTAPAEEGSWLSQIKKPLTIIDDVFESIRDWFDLRRQDFDGTSDSVPEHDDLTTLNSWKLTSRTFPRISQTLAELVRMDKTTGCRLPDRLIQKLEEFASTLGLVFGGNGSKLRDFRVVYRRGSEQKWDELLMLCMNPGIVFESLCSSCHSIILSSGTLSPLNSFASELGVRFDVQISANHVIDSSQILSMVIPHTDTKFQFSSAFTKLTIPNYRTTLHIALGELFERLLPLIPGGVLFFVPSYDFLSKLAETWKSAHFFTSLSAIKPLFVEKPGANDPILTRYKSAIHTGRGAFLLGVCRGSISEGMDFSDDQARAVFVFGIPYPNYRDIDVTLKKAYNDIHSKNFTNRRLLSANEWYDAQAYRAIGQAVGRCIRHQRDYGAIILLDERFTTQTTKFPSWVRRSLLIHTTLDTVTTSLSSFFTAMAKRFPTVGPTSINLEFESTLDCAACGTKILMLRRFDPQDVEVVEREGFRRIVGSDTALFCAVIGPTTRSEVSVSIPPAIWAPEDSIAYRPICCVCGVVVGAHLFAVSNADDRLRDTFWMVIDRLTVCQGGSVCPFEAVVGDDDTPNWL
jgi:Fanconi anemia group J protein